MDAHEDALKTWLRSQLSQARIGGHSVAAWDHWGLYLDPSRVETILDRLESAMGGRIRSVDYLCPIPKSGLVLGSLLANRLGMPLLNFWWGDGVYCQEQISPGVKIALFDPDVKTGKSLHSALMTLEAIKPTIECLVTIVYHDQ